ncbi:hypothetical protein SAMN05444722_1675 [Rhodovulum sp. ES.010]|uniref:hypothetical protein n=1 Tax=Rhodovulum sp. ES.010 TaxID=1882821 RepID=UPI00092BB542|nr:hypothetical protein [Rhodovulum sp. ES.010]SIO36245.1 hypothetical protein SAMN05444722_1675 [Rhodovulum sp. ES.010]
MIELTEAAAKTALAILAGLILVWIRTDGMAVIGRLGVITASAAAGLALGSELALWLGTPERLTLVGVTVLGPLVLEVAATVLLLAKKNPAAVVDLLRQWRGK